MLHECKLHDHNLIGDHTRYAQIMKVRSQKNSAKNSGPRRDARGRLRGGNPGNSGGKKGRSGRPKQAFRHWALNLRNNRVVEIIEEILDDPDHRDVFKAIDYVSRYAGERERLLTVPECQALMDALVAIMCKHVDRAVAPAIVEDVRLLKASLKWTDPTQG